MLHLLNKSEHQDDLTPDREPALMELPVGHPTESSAGLRSEIQLESPARVERPAQARSVYSIPCVWSASNSLYPRLPGGLNPRSMLVLKLDHVGDFSLALDALLALREAFPETRILFACAPWNVGLATELGLFDEIVAIPFFPPRADAPHFPFDPEIVAPLRDHSFDLAVDLRVDPDTRIVLDHVSAGLKFGYESDRNRQPLTCALPVPAASIDGDNLFQHQSLLMLRLAQTVIALNRPPATVSDSLRSRLALDTVPDVIAGLPRPIVAICTGSGRKAKDWALPRFGEIVSWLGSIGASVVLMGTATQQTDADYIMQAHRIPHLLSLVGRTSMQEALRVIAHADLFFGNDTALTHYAARLDTPTVAVYSGIDPTAVWAPVGRHVTVIKAPVPCSPCHILLLEDCRFGHACMQNIPPAVVKPVIRKALTAHVIAGIQGNLRRHEPESAS